MVLRSPFFIDVVGSPHLPSFRTLIQVPPRWIVLFQSHPLASWVSFSHLRLTCLPASRPSWFFFDPTPPARCLVASPFAAPPSLLERSPCFSLGPNDTRIFVLLHPLSDCFLLPFARRKTFLGRLNPPLSPFSFFVVVLVLSPHQDFFSLVRSALTRRFLLTLVRAVGPTTMTCNTSASE